MRFNQFARTAIVLSCLTPLANARPNPSPSLDALIAAVAARNLIGHEVAAAKYPLHRPVEDSGREAQVLAAKREQAQALGLDPDAVEVFYRHLIEANKLVQYLDYYHFARGTAPPPAPSLDALRTRIDAVDGQLLALWPALDSLRVRPDCEQVVATAVARRGAVEQTALIRALAGLCTSLPGR